MLDCNVNELFDALEAVSLMDDYEFEKLDSNLKTMDIF